MLDNIVNLEERTTFCQKVTSDYHAAYEHSIHNTCPICAPDGADPDVTTPLSSGAGPDSEVVCEVNGVPVLMRDDSGAYKAPEGLRGIAAYFESRGIPEKQCGLAHPDCEGRVRCYRAIGHNGEHRARLPNGFEPEWDDCLYEDDIQHIRIELPNGPSFRFRVPEGWDPDVSAHGLPDAGHTILTVEREESDEH